MERAKLRKVKPEQTNKHTKDLLGLAVSLSQKMVKGFPYESRNYNEPALSQQTFVTKAEKIELQNKTLYVYKDLKIANWDKIYPNTNTICPLIRLCVSSTGDKQNPS